MLEIPFARCVISPDASQQSRAGLRYGAASIAGDSGGWRQHLHRDRDGDRDERRVPVLAGRRHSASEHPGSTIVVSANSGMGKTTRTRSMPSVQWTPWTAPAGM